MSESRTASKYESPTECFKERLRYTFSMLEPMRLKNMKKELREILRNQASTRDPANLDSIQASLSTAGVSETDANHVRGTISDEKMMGVFKKVIGIRAQSDKRRYIQSESVLDEDGLSDASSVPAGLEFYSEKRRPSVLTIKRARLIPPPSINTGEDSEYYVYVYNLPFGVTEEDIRNSLCNVGQPSEVTVYDARGGVKDCRSQIWIRNSPIHGVLKFDSKCQFSKATRIENKLFGILCKSRNESRTMLLESAERKKALVFSNYQSNTFRDILEILEGHGSVHSENISDDLSVNMKHGSLLVEFERFGDAFKVFKELQGNPKIRSGAMHFNLYRSKWMEGGYFDHPHPFNFIIE